MRLFTFDAESNFVDVAPMPHAPAFRLGYAIRGKTRTKKALLRTGMMALKRTEEEKGLLVEMGCYSHHLTGGKPRLELKAQ